MTNHELIEWVEKEKQTVNFITPKGDDEWAQGYRKGFLRMADNILNKLQEDEPENEHKL